MFQALQDAHDDDNAHDFCQVLRKSTATAGLTTSLLQATSDSTLAFNMPALFKAFHGALPPEVLQRPGLVHGLSSRMLENFMACRGVSPTHWSVGWTLGTSALLWDKYGTLFFMPTILFGGADEYANANANSDSNTDSDSDSDSDSRGMHFSLLCRKFNAAAIRCESYARASVARLFAHCVATVCAQLNVASLTNVLRGVLIHANILDRILSGITDVSTKDAFPSLEMENLVTAFQHVFPSLFDEATFPYRTPYRTFGYRVLQTYVSRRQMGPIRALRKTGFVKRYATQHLDALLLREPDFLETILLSDCADEQQADEAWFVDLEAVDPAAVRLAHFVMSRYVRRKFSGGYGGYWIQRMLRTVPRVNIIRTMYPEMFGDTTVNLLVNAMGKLLESFLKKNPDVMDSNAHAMAMADFLVEQRLPGDTDVLGVLDVLQKTCQVVIMAEPGGVSCTRLTVAAEFNTRGFARAANYAAFDDSLRCAWLLACVQTDLPDDAAVSSSKRIRNDV